MLQFRGNLPSRFSVFCLVLAVTATPNTFAVVRYVNGSNAFPAPPYVTWATAATNIQDAIDAANAGDEILVTNGVYATGSRVVHGTLINRVALIRAVTVRSVNGPEVTSITGDDDAGRAAYLTNGATLAGFTLVNGTTLFEPLNPVDGQGGAVWSESVSCVISNCIITHSDAVAGGGVFGGRLDRCTLRQNSALNGGAAYGAVLRHCTILDNEAGDGGGAYESVLDNCLLKGNTADDAINNADGDGGGACRSTLSNCVLSDNQGYYGGGAASSALNSCTLSNNVAATCGGGAFGSALTNCFLTGNRALHPDYGGGGAAWSVLDRCSVVGNQAVYGGGTTLSALHRCVLSGNSARDGGGSHSDRLFNCLVTSNSAWYAGGGAFNAMMVHCTVVDNSASVAGGAGGTLTNCIVYDNRAPGGNPNGGGTFQSCCATPMPTFGSGNITNAPQFANAAAGDYRLRPGSQAIDTGLDLSADITADLDGTLRPLDGNKDGILAFDMGAYEFNPLFFTSIMKFGNRTRLCWFDSLAGMQLQAAGSLNNPVWTNVPVTGGTNCVELPLDSSNTFFRLLKP